MPSVGTKNISVFDPFRKMSFFTVDLVLNDLGERSSDIDTDQIDDLEETIVRRKKLFS